MTAGRIASWRLSTAAVTLLATLCSLPACSQSGPPATACHLVLVPLLAPLGHYVLADIYERHGRSAEARKEVASAERLKRGRG